MNEAPPPPDTAFEESILRRIGNTPLVRLRRLPGADAAIVLCKCEHLNPGGSVKDRAALAMVEAAERDGRLIPGQSVIIEATSGNTGIGLALVAAVKGYRLILTMPENMSEERRALLRAYGAEIHLTPARQVMQGAVQKADAIAARYPGAFMPQQFRNPMNPEVHRRTTGPEILAELGARVPDAFVAGVGTGGTITGVGEVLRARFPDVALVAVEPQASAVLSGGPPGPHGIQGIGAGFVPEVLRRDLLSDVRQVTEADARAMRIELARREGLLVGISSGAAVCAAIDVARNLGAGKLVVTLLPDTGERYVGLGERG
ncbi:MAG TPA: cysteine synthase A [Polyangia bacterium]|nr:cysteine synthase A [Polyangia bacterium]